MATKMKRDLSTWVMQSVLKITQFLPYIVGPAIHIGWWMYVLPDITEHFQSHIIAILLFSFELFLFINIILNMAFDVVTNSKTVVSENNGEKYCELCIGYVPKNSWHCQKCKMCVFRREEHCWVLNHCIALLNKRYHTLLLTYSALNCALIMICIFVSMFKNGVGSFIEDIKFAMSKVDVDSARARKISSVLFYHLQLLVNCLFLFGALGYDALLHWNSILRGVTVERRNAEAGSGDWRKNMERVFGKRWHVALFLPFLPSPLPTLEEKHLLASD